MKYTGSALANAFGFVLGGTDYLDVCLGFLKQVGIVGGRGDPLAVDLRSSRDNRHIYTLSR